MSTYTFELPEFGSDAEVAERTLRGLDTVSHVDTDPGSETLTVTSSLSYSEMLGVIRDSGIAAR
ncbi:MULTISPECIES: hypothetical protein [Nocardia]|uniref:HMA domain-containing protein n=1 Tax=Nocardia wallacei TaxID=480035 RepID=A0A7G1KP08_9NOCA|nr:hypothetical protein [Nocardia wallacei]BCK56561.1 hypothetical protein NWFMUON74_43330 [Nocardia wallacei]